MMNRRAFLGSLAGATALSAVRFSPLNIASAANIGDPHFLIHLYYTGGVDASYLFDAPHPNLRTAKLHQHYLETAPTVWQGANGGQTLASSLTSPLSSLKDYFSVINGVVMSEDNDGHGQNLNKLFTQSTSGGVPYLDYIGETGTSLIDTIEFNEGFLGPQFSGSGKRVRLGADGLTALIKTAASQPTKLTSLDSYIVDRAKSIGKGSGTLSAGARAIAASLPKGPDLASRVAGIEPVSPDADDLTKALQYSLSLFKRNMAQCTTLTGTLNDFNFDTHDVESARNQQESVGALVGQVKQLIDTLRGTPYNGQKSFYDVTTFVISTEFSRTNRQATTDFDNTGTDHNPFGNSLLIGGKGIRSSLVCGATDLHILSEGADAFAGVSKRHRELDPELVKPMGLPIDGQTLRPFANDATDKYEPLRIESVANTLMTNFGVPNEAFFSTSGGEKAPVLTGLLKR